MSPVFHRAKSDTIDEGENKFAFIRFEKIFALALQPAKENMLKLLTEMKEIKGNACASRECFCEPDKLLEWDELANECACRPNTGLVWDGSTCVCRSEENFVWDGSTCVCDSSLGNNLFIL